ncbi:MAG TPA: aldo/keto reductase [Ardenticatenaceae bacterium]|nr:aldo/keto reductase [Ardenticatenaceae bacterium]
MTAIKKRLLGKSGIEVTEIGMGLWAAGGDAWGPTDDRAVLDAIDYALDAGINFYDTADVYGSGHSEELLGQAMRGRRDQFVVATKIGWQGFDHERKQSAYDSVEKLVAGVESNLRRLQTDYIDVMQSHINYREPTLEAVLEGFQRLQAQGKLRAYGVSTSDFDYLKQLNHDGHCSTLQIDYSILNRTPEEEILPYCQEHGIGVIVRGALAMGILTGKFSADAQFAEGDFRQNWQTDPQQNAIFLDDLEKVERLRPLANGRSLAQLAMQFVLAHPAVSTVSPGAKSARQLRETASAALLPPLPEDELASIAGVTPPGGGRKIWPA